MKHYLITPWNVSNNDLAWLEQRVELFEQFCLPTVQAQTFKEFEWLIVADCGTPSYIKTKLEAYPATILYYQFEPIKLNQGRRNRHRRARGLEVSIAQPVREYLKPVITDKIITSRLDSDDAISIDHLAKINRAAHNTHNQRYWINLVRGLKYNRGNVYPKNSLTSPFISFVEPQGELLTAYQCSHGAAGNTPYKIIQIREGKPTWLQVIHGGNLVNKQMRFRGEAPFSTVSSRFKIEKGASPETPF